MLTERLEADLVKIAPERREARFYRLTIWSDLFGRCSLAREYGRIGQPGTPPPNPFKTRDTAAEALRRLLPQKQRRRYQAAGSHQGWMSPWHLISQRQLACAAARSRSQTDRSW